MSQMEATSKASVSLSSSRVVPVARRTCLLQWIVPVCRVLVARSTVWSLLASRRLVGRLVRWSFSVMLDHSFFLRCSVAIQPGDHPCLAAWSSWTTCLLVDLDFRMNWMDWTHHPRISKTLRVSRVWTLFTRRQAVKLERGRFLNGPKSSADPWRFVEFETAGDLKTAVDKLDDREFKGSRVACVADVSLTSRIESTYSFS